MTDQYDDAARWSARVQTALSENEQQVSTAIQDRLAVARREAVTVADRTQASRWNKYIGPGALASAALVLVLVVARPATEQNLQNQIADLLPLIEETDMAAAQDAELLEELEFVAWMLAEEIGDDELGQG